MSNELTSRARTFTEALQNFPQNLIEITLQITPNKLLFRNYVDDESRKKCFTSSIYKMQNNVVINILLSINVN